MFSIKTEIGEYVVGAYLSLVEKCDAIVYNVKPPGGGIEGLGELDVIGYRFTDKSVFMCEVATHLNGLLIVGKNNKDNTVNKVKEKHDRQKLYASKYLNLFEHVHFMLWSPVVRGEEKIKGLSEISELELIINEEYSHKINILKELARKSDTKTSDIGNPFFRTLQLLQRLR